uniref:Mammalian ependymin-related protein 1 n=2 Tax=Magallana gigas TaxID=29159 RepID=A0A8W8JTS3_MAGGI
MYTVFLLVAVGASLFLGTVQQCCGPSKLQTYFDVLTFLPGGRGSTVTYNMSYDAVTKRVAYHVFGNSMQEDVDAIIDYRANMSYVWSEGVCDVSHANQFHEMCFPEGKLVRKSFMGVFPDIIKLNTYLISDDQGRYSFTIAKPCTPVEMERQQTDFLMLNRFYNMTLGIKNESVFTPPKICFKKESRISKTYETPLLYRAAAMFGQVP